MASGDTLPAGEGESRGGDGGGRVVFKFTLPGISTDFTAAAVTHNCNGGGSGGRGGKAAAKFLGMKRTFYLECGPFEAGADVAVSVAADRFTIKSRPREWNVASPPFTLHVR